MLGADVSRLPLESVPVNVWDEEDELPQDLSVADVRHLPFLKDHPNPQRRIAELFGEVVMFDSKGNPITTKTVRPGKEEMKKYSYYFKPLLTHLVYRAMEKKKSFFARHHAKDVDHGEGGKVAAHPVWEKSNEDYASV